MKKVAELVFGTKNRAKVDQLQGALASSHVTVIGLEGFGELPTVEEDGKTLMANAVKKAQTYATAIGQQVLSMDNGLWLDDLPDNEQPGIHVRRINGIDRATDDELLTSYTDLINAHGGKMTGRFRYAIVIARPNGHFVSTEIDDRRLFVSKPCTESLPGYPLESLCIDPVTNTYVAAMSEMERSEFWQRVIGKPMAEFIEQNVA